MQRRADLRVRRNRKRGGTSIEGASSEHPCGKESGCDRMADCKYATWMQWSVMWYSETSAGCKMAVMVGGASCWAGNRSQDFAGLRSRTGPWTTLVGEKGEAEKGRGSRRREAKDKTKEGQSRTDQFTALRLVGSFNFSLLMSSRRRGDAMSLRAANEIILDIIRQNANQMVSVVASTPVQILVPPRNGC